MQIFELLIRLRQICCHPILYKSISKFVTDSSKFADQLHKFIKKLRILKIIVISFDIIRIVLTCFNLSFRYKV